VHFSQLEAITVQVDRVSVIRLIIEYEAIALTLLKRSWLRLLIEAIPVDGPAIKSSFATIYLAENKRDRFVRILGHAILTEERIIPRPLLWLHPTRWTGLVGIFDNDPHSVLSVVVHGRTQDPDSGILHLHNCRNSLGRSQFEHFDELRVRHRISVKRDNLELMAGQTKLNIFRGTRVQKMEQDALAFFYSHGLAVPERLAVNREPLIADLPSVRFLLLLLSLLLFAFEVRILLVFRLHLLGPEERLKLVSGQEHLLIVLSGIVPGLDIDDSELPGIGAAIQI
jgi:hypothetical protein